MPLFAVSSIVLLHGRALISKQALSFMRVALMNLLFYSVPNATSKRSDRKGLLWALEEVLVLQRGWSLLYVHGGKCVLASDGPVKSFASFPSIPTLIFTSWRFTHTHFSLYFTLANLFFFVTSLL